MFDSASVNYTHMVSICWQHNVLTYLHLIHSFLSVPMQEGFTLEHGGELIANALEQLLDGGRVTEESDGHLVSSGGNVALRSKNVVGNPFNEVR